MSEVLSPVQIEQTIREAANRISKGVQVVSERYREFLRADHALDVAYAKAYLSGEGSIEDRKKAAELATVTERETRDEADAAFRYADRQWRALTAELDAYRSIGASVRQAYATGGGSS